MKEDGVSTDCKTLALQIVTQSVEKDGKKGGEELITFVKEARLIELLTDGDLSV
jgi:hypothetical protein